MLRLKHMADASDCALALYHLKLIGTFGYKRFHILSVLSMINTLFFKSDNYF